MWNTITSFIFTYRYPIVIVLILALYAWFDWKDFKAEAYKAIFLAKKWAKDSAAKGIIRTGLEQEDWVINMLLVAAGKFSWTRFLNEQTKRKIIKKLYDSGLDLLDNGKLDNSIYKLEPTTTEAPAADGNSPPVEESVPPDSNIQ